MRHTIVVVVVQRVRESRAANKRLFVLLSMGLFLIIAVEVAFLLTRFFGWSW